MKKWILWSGIGLLCLVLTTTLVIALRPKKTVDIAQPAQSLSVEQEVQFEDVVLCGWQTVGDQIFYFDPESGEKVTGWLETEQGRYYLDENGNPCSGWLAEENKIYLLKPDGTVCTGWVETERGARYFGADGAMAVGLLEQSGGVWCFTDDGMPYTGWYDDTYYFDEQGKALTGWQEMGAESYYFFPDGIAADGWTRINGAQYYFSAGVMQSGWYTEGKDRYFFREDGTMAIGQVEIDGVTRFFTSTGKYVVLVNFQYPVPEDYVLNLVKVEGKLFDADAADDLEALLAACRAAGYPCYIKNSYRSEETQQYMYDKRLQSYMDGGMDADAASQLVTQSLMLPGHSEHHLGLALDVKCTNAAYGWLGENSWQYGFIIRYPEGKADITGIMYEPWHLRYVGKELAAELYESGLCLEEYMQQITLSIYDGQ